MNDQSNVTPTTGVDSSRFKCTSIVGLGLLIACAALPSTAHGSEVPEAEVPTKVAEKKSFPASEPGTAKIHESGWTTPIKLPFNDDGWEDSPYVMRDGSSIIFFYHPFGDLITRIEEALVMVLTEPDEAIERGLDGKIYMSHRPFTEKEIHPVSQVHHPATECCFYISQSGDYYYGSTKRAFELGEDVPETVYRNGDRLDFGTGQEEANPHYCDAKDEMWFDCPGDTNICRMKDAARSGFKGEVEVAPHPINSQREDVDDFQPYLTDDCRTLYFTSTRQGQERMAIYRTTRLDEEGQNWSEPELFISHDAGVAELSMTADGTELIFAQIFWRESGGVGIDIYYSRKY